MVFFSQRKIERATIVVALFFISHLSFAKASNIETYADVIDKAINLSIQKDRNQALSILTNAIKKESKKGTAPKDLVVAANDIALMFYSDNAQQIFETALSFKKNDPNLCLSKLNEASSLEPDNLNILLEQIRSQMIMGSCSSALKKAIGLQEKYFFSDPLKLTIAQSAICSGDFDQYLQIKPVDLKKSAEYLSWQQIQIEYLFKTGKFEKALEALEVTENIKDLDPEFYYLKLKVQSELKIKNEATAQKYLSECKKVSARRYRELSNSPFLCRHTSEVETYLKKSHN